MRSPERALEQKLTEALQAFVIGQMSAGELERRLQAEMAIVSDMYARVTDRYEWADWRHALETYHAALEHVVASLRHDGLADPTPCSQAIELAAQADRLIMQFQRETMLDLG